MPERTEAHLPDNWATGDDYTDQVTRELLALIKMYEDDGGPAAAAMRKMVAEAWSIGYVRGASPGWDAVNPFADN
jgi:hypothetical protein